MLQYLQCCSGTSLSSRTNYQVLILVLVLGAQVFVLVLVLVLWSSSPRKFSRIKWVNVACEISSTISSCSDWVTNGWIICHCVLVRFKFMSISPYCFTPVLLSSRKVLVLEDPRGPIFKSSSSSLKLDSLSLSSSLSLKFLTASHEYLLNNIESSAVEHIHGIRWFWEDLT